ncbi:hypothetical protein NUU61_006430 [Penicillium alfredii]|uniref:Uncharacterized protein n=1 Tax=Penicillium alfredii TaxID=1506179 RepID=A0A9W9K3L9_9EURO|nr:uncharacterized protein NUU61_006430 [Penicillium alfredii]KAJ5091560.1 hypothetical protein NUU61_006430 [Penicillium alfredii]
MTSPSESRVAIITGATGGMGIKIAQTLCAQGWKITCLDLQQEAGDALVESLGQDNAMFVRTNLAKYEDQVHAFRETFRRWGRIDALCANAGIVDRSSVYIYNWREKKADDVPPEPDLSTTDVDYKAVVYGVQLATHFMRHNPQPGGRIVVTSSIASIFPHPSYPEYCGAKAAVNIFVQGIAPLLKQKENIFINCVLPGIVPTPIIPPEMIAAVAPEHLTPVETIVKAFQTFLEDSTGMTGELLECSGEKLIYYKPREMGNGAATKRAVTVWEPLFQMMHKETSQLADAIP